MKTGITKEKYPRADCLKVAEEICAALRPYIERLEIAGSVRRGKSECSDVEILYIPKMVTRAKDMFETEPVDLAAEKINWLLTDGIIAKRLNKVGYAAWGAKNKLALHVASGIPVDLFATTLENWFMSLIIRTGPTKLNLRLISGTAARGYQLHAYGTFTHIESGLAVAVKSEEEVFMRAGLPYLQPQDR